MSTKRTGNEEDTDEQTGWKGNRCGQRLAHPLHTYKIDSLCSKCAREKEDRLARFEMGVTDDGIIREMQPQRGNRGVTIRKLTAVEGQKVNGETKGENTGQKG